MKLLLCFIMLFSNYIAPVSASQNVVTVVADSCYVYENPDFDMVFKIESSPLICNFGDKLNVVENDTTLDFIKVEVVNGEAISNAYIYRYYVTFNDVEQDIYPVFNASVRKDNVIIYDLDKNETQFTAKKGQGLYLYNGYSDKEDFTAVALVLEDGSLYYGFIKTEDIAPKGISGALITGVVVIISCLTVIFLLLFMKKRIKRQ